MNELLERTAFLTALSADLTSLQSSGGRIALVCGEAGIGKTTLLEHFAATRTDARFLWGACEALLTPNPLGPLSDIAREASGSLKSLLAQHAERATLFAAMLDEMAAAPSPVVVVIEDVHWADAATLDLITYLGRRVARVPALLVLSYRDDEIDAVHPLRLVLGQLPARHVTRLALTRLTPAAVDALAREARRDSAGLFAATGGNPFFVTEVLADRNDMAATAVPANVRDAVLSRAARLSPRAREVLELAAIVPREVEQLLIENVLPQSLAAIEECVHCGLLIADTRTLRFRHELARVAVETSLPPPTTRTLHARLLDALSAISTNNESPPLARLVHHAFHAGDGAAVLKFAPQAAREAEVRGARREAAAQCRAALSFASQLTDAAHADLLEDYARHCFELNDLAAAITARETAISLYTRTGNSERLCASLAAHAMPLVRALRNAEADTASLEAIAIAESLPPGPLLARAYETEAYLRMLNRDCAEAVRWGQKAIALAQLFNDTPTLAAAWNSTGAARMFIDAARGREEILTSLRIATSLRDGGAAAADAYMMIGSAAAELFDFATAGRYLAEGIAFASRHDLDRLAGYMEAWVALIDVFQGNWDAAGERANALLSRMKSGSTNRVTALIALARLRIRRGDPGVAELLDEALALARSSGTLQRLAPVVCLSAEQAWLGGSVDRVRPEIATAFDLAVKKQHPWYAGELGYWLWKADALPGDVDVSTFAAPYALQLSGRWRESAHAWRALGCPYETGRTLTQGDREAQLEALAIFERLGAGPIIERLRADMRRDGVRGIPRGPRQTTRENTAGLTTRELEVLSLVAEGQSNSDIARRLSRSLRTIDHHVAAILDKLSAATRTEAVAAARRMGILAQK